MNVKKCLLYGTLIFIIGTAAGLSIWLSPGTEMTGLQIACNDDAAGLLIKYLAGEKRAALQVVSMSYQQLPDCCSSQTELALAADYFDLAVLCPDGAEKLLASGQPYEVLGTVVVNAKVLVTRRDALPGTVGYMNAREIQKQLVWSNFDKSIAMQPMLPTGLPYALERKAVEGIVLDILGALKIEGYRWPLPSEYATSVLVVRRDLLDSPDLAGFIQAYNLAVADMNRTEILKVELAKYLAVENGDDEVEIWREMGTQFQPLEI